MREARRADQYGVKLKTTIDNMGRRIAAREQISEYVWSEYDKVRKELNLYTTTIHVINSCIVKMGKLTVAKPVYRGMSYRLIPEQFWKPNAEGVMGGVEFAMPMTQNKSRRPR